LLAARITKIAAREIINAEKKFNKAIMPISQITPGVINLLLLGLE